MGDFINFINLDATAESKRPSRHVLMHKTKANVAATMSYEMAPTKKLASPVCTECVSAIRGFANPTDSSVSSASCSDKHRATVSHPKQPHAAAGRVGLGHSQSMPIHGFI